MSHTSCDCDHFWVRMVSCRIQSYQLFCKETRCPTSIDKRHQTTTQSTNKLFIHHQKQEETQPRTNHTTNKLKRSNQREEPKDVWAVYSKRGLSSQNWSKGEGQKHHNTPSPPIQVQRQVCFPTQLKIVKKLSHLICFICMQSSAWKAKQNKYVPCSECKTEEKKKNEVLNTNRSGKAKS